MSGAARRWRLLALLLVALALGGVPPSALRAGQEASQAATFDDLSAAPLFPDTIEFRLAADSPVEIVRAELLFAPRWEDTPTLIEADLTSGTQVDLTFSLDMFEHYLPPGLDILYRWRLTDAAGNETTSPEQTVLWLDTRFAWQEVATDQVTVSYYTGNETFNLQILDSAQRTIDELQTTLSVERSRPLRIWVYNSADEFGAALLPNSEPFIRGASYLGRYLILAVIPDGSTGEIDRIVPHEVSHQVLYQATENPFNRPALWLDEGLAVYNQDTDRDLYAPTLQEAVRSGSLLPLASISSTFPNDDTYHLAYAEALSVVEFIIAEWGEEGLGRVIAAYREGVSHDEAVERGLGISLTELDRRWKTSLGYAGDRPLDDGTGGPGFVTTGPARPSAGTLMLATGTVVIVLVVGIRRRLARGREQTA